MLNEIIKYVKHLGVTDDHAAQTIAHNVLLDEKAKGYEFRKAKLLAYNELNPKRKSKIEQSLIYLDATLDGSDGEMSSLHDVIAYDDFNKRNTDLQMSQRTLIETLSMYSDCRTKEIIATFLSLDNPTVTAVGKELGINHTTVTRSLKRLAKNFEESEFGNISEYLSA